MDDSPNLNNTDNDRTKERILDEAEALFALKGYDSVSVREITGAANCNLAAVNYHFGNKKKLYLEVFRSRWLPRATRIKKKFQESLKATGSLTPSAVVQSLARSFLEGPLSEEEHHRHHQLIFSELAKPTEAFEMVADQAFRPLFDSLIEDLRCVLPDDIGEERLALNICSVFAMVLYFNFARTLISSFTGCDYDAAFKGRLVDHIVEFSINGLGAD
jgi:TetR/AcrR family transcriptional regulator, regulator of cefoperazone and chloramphenicol sensitivity